MDSPVGSEPPASSNLETENGLLHPPELLNACEYGAPTVPAGNVVVITGLPLPGAVPIGSVRFCVAVAPAASVTVTANVYAPGEADDPVSAPLAGFSVNPAGSDAALKEYGGRPPVAEIVAEYGVFTVAAGRDVVVMASGPAPPAPAWVIVKSWPPMVIPPVRCAPELGITVNDTEPLEVPLAPAVMLIQLALALAFHAQPAPAAIDMFPVPPAAGKDCDGGNNVYVQGAPGSTVSKISGILRYSPTSAAIP
jgi:hypothetical protein